MNITYQQISGIYLSKGYTFFDTGEYNVNIFGVRSQDLLADEFNDFIGVAYKDEFGNSFCHVFKATTKPGYYWLKKKLGTPNGTAILIPGQYRSCWKLGHHRSYEALVQSRNEVFDVWRDNDSDGELDTGGQVFADVTGLNLHTTSFINDVDKVGKYSAGCQVIQDDLDFNLFMSIVKESVSRFGNSFSYTLFDQNDIEEHQPLI